ncbi:DUF1573 domain-containing protein [Nibribacter ruber]|uniref:DUF1573 domain-containing protein n=1 Tax=Nibribacter ruber TaxID=2698458 RepID=A0A6P1NR92_9BACT|nr:DUF1573 domain-containing protein [Nibribacter ruber]QHL86197.1 DUF1573 domain-containing protein [Nibribacter ruber]
MKKTLLWLLFLLLGSTAAMAQTKPDSTVVEVIAPAPPVPAGPSIVFEEAKFDFGTIKQGEVVEHTFLFTNNGSQPLVISNVRTTCGCTVPTWPKTPIQPGQTAEITARFNSAGKMGQQNKVITIDSNALQGTTQVIIATKIVAAQ